MRRLAAQIETLGPVHFILLIGLAAGAIQALPRLFFPATGALPFQPLAFLVISVTAVLWWTAALVLWWITIRRRRWGVWNSAVQVTLGLVVADLVVIALATVVSSIATRGAVPLTLLQQPMTVVLSNLGITALRCPVWFVGAVLTIAVGRHLGGESPTLSATTSAVASLDAVP